MHDLLRVIGTGLFVGVFALPAGAQELRAPSFNCDKASAADEKAICDNYSIAWLDRQLDRAWQEAVQRAGGSGFSDLKAAQKAWLKSRRACGKGVDCLLSSYLKRLKELATSDADGANLTASYGYALGENGGGSLSLVHHDDDTLAGAIETVTGPTAHLCNVHFEAARKIGDFYLWTGPRDEADFDGRQCQILLQPAGAGIKIDSLHCSYYCGARGTFDWTYQKN